MLPFGVGHGFGGMGPVVAGLSGEKGPDMPPYKSCGAAVGLRPETTQMAEAGQHDRQLSQMRATAKRPQPARCGYALSNASKVS